MPERMSTERQDSGYHSLGSIPFSWENHPGISKQSRRCTSKDDTLIKQQLTPPPYRLESPKLLRPGLYIPLPPFPLGSPARPSLKRRGSRTVEEDPFLAAYLEVTKSKREKAKVSEERKTDDVRGWIGLGRRVFGFGLSCKHTCGVREDAVVRLTQLPPPPAGESYLERRWRQRKVHERCSTYP